MTRLRGVAAACVCVGVFALAAVPALADGTSPQYPGSVLHVSVEPGSGSTFTVVATGSNTEDFEIEVVSYLVEAGGPACATDETAEFGLFSYPTVTHVASDLIGIDEGSPPGPFTVKFQAEAPAGYSGKITVCAYSVDETNTAAWASTTTTVKSASPTSTTPTGGGGGGKPGAPKTSRPRVIARPQVTRQGHQLLCSRGRWSGKPKSYRYKWIVTRQVGSPSFTNKLAITRKMHGQQAECQVTASNSKGPATATSKPVKIK